MPSPSRSSSSSSPEFEFTISISPRKSSLCPADDLFYKGQLLPLQLSPRISMVRNLILASSSEPTQGSPKLLRQTCSSSHSGNSTDFTILAECDSSAIAGDHTTNFETASFQDKSNSSNNHNGNAVKRVSATAKEVLRKYLKKAKPLYDKLSKPPPHRRAVSGAAALSQSFSGDPRRRKCKASMRSTSHGSGGFYGETTSEELQSAIQGAIAHCKNSMHKTNQI